MNSTKISAMWNACCTDCRKWKSSVFIHTLWAKFGRANIRKTYCLFVSGMSVGWGQLSLCLRAKCDILFVKNGLVISVRFAKDYDYCFAFKTWSRRRENDDTKCVGLTCWSCDEKSIVISIDDKLVCVCVCVCVCEWPTSVPFAGRLSVKQPRMTLIYQEKLNI
jgi:hypothetical protein